MTNRLWRVGHEYRDRGGIKFEDDEVLKWLATEAGTIANSGGIRFKDPISNPSIDLETGKVVPAYFILVTSDMSAHHHNPWDDLIDEVSGNINYWGDAKFGDRTRHYNQFKGNARLEAANNLRLSGRSNEIPPILHFSKKRSGYLTFNGLCALSDIKHAWFEDNERPVKNIRALLSILDAEEVSVEWLNQRVISGDSHAADKKLAPSAWLKAKKGRIERRHVWASRIRTREQQIPRPGSIDENILEQVRSLTPTEFEVFTVALVEKLPDIIPGLEHKVTRTRRTGDHGLDFFGMFRLPWPISYQIDFLGEAKRYTSPISPDQVSRLVARLGRGQYGLYFTTSWFSEQTQREIEADRYPVRLFSGQDIVNILRAGECISSGIINKEWLATATSEVVGPVSDGLKPISIW
jgi:hypothetical protein